MNKLTALGVCSSLALATAPARALDVVDVGTGIEPVLKVGAFALTSKAPPPFNGIGAGLINVLWPSRSNGKSQANIEAGIDEINTRIDHLQGTADAILENQEALRNDLHRMIREGLGGQVYHSIEATIASVVDDVGANYENKRNVEHPNIGKLEQQLEVLRAKVHDAVFLYLHHPDVSPAHEMATIGELVTMAELELMLLQELAWIFTSEFGGPCSDDCTARRASLEGHINSFRDSTDRYVARLQWLAAEVERARLARIQSVSETSEDDIRTGCRIVYPTPYTTKWECDTYPFGVRYRLRAQDTATGEVLVDDSLYCDTSAFVACFYYELPARRQRAAAAVEEHRQRVRTKVYEDLTDLRSIMANLAAAKQPFDHVDGVVAQGCVLASSPTDGAEHVICDTSTFSTLAHFPTNFQLGQNTSIEVFSGPSCEGPGAVIDSNATRRAAASDFGVDVVQSLLLRVDYSGGVEEDVFELCLDVVPPPSIEGEYENHLYDGGGKNNWHYVTITQVSQDTYRWENRAGASWTLFATDDPQTLRVGSDCPYYGSGHTRASVAVVDGRVVSISGPWNETYDRN
jgi:hypothetical protein